MYPDFLFFSTHVNNASSNIGHLQDRPRFAYFDFGISLSLSLDFRQSLIIFSVTPYCLAAAQLFEVSTYSTADNFNFAEYRFRLDMALTCMDLFKELIVLG